MAKIDDLIAQIPEDRLRKAIAIETKLLKKTNKSGLVFEEHLQETVRLPLLPVRAGELVALKRESGNQLWRVISIHKGTATCEKLIKDSATKEVIRAEHPLPDLVIVRNFGDPIYPALIPIDRVQGGSKDKPWHILINADNFHALQLLLFTCERKVDMIYIDPPYNTGARDWKYNNDYVDLNDPWRHSKWLYLSEEQGAYVIKVGGQEVLRTRSQKSALKTFNQLRKDMQDKFPSPEVSGEEKKALFQKFIDDSLVGPNSVRKRKKSTARSTRTFG